MWRLLGALLFTPVAAWSQEPYVASNAPADRPHSVDSARWARAVAAMAPYVTQARATYPQAKKRYLAGLPPRHSFFVTARLRDTGGGLEQAFVAVDSIVADRIYGRIWNQLHTVRGFQLYDRYHLAETELIDWLITRPDGTEDGNVVGKFLDTYHPD